MAKVYVLGAGASTEYRRLSALIPPVPTDKTFWSALESIISRSGENEGPKLNETDYLNYPQLTSYLKAKYRVSNLSELNSLGLENVFICKLHGSTGWLPGEPSDNPKRVYLFLSGNSKDARLIGEGHLRRGPIIVPPMQRKKFPPLLTQVWTKAKEALLTANAVLFIG